MMDLEHVSVERGKRLIVDGVTFTVPDKQCVALVGPNGCGKSTLVAAIAGDLACRSGHIRIDEIPVATSSHQQLARLRAVMTQESSTAFGFTVREVVAMGRSPWSASAPADDDMIVENAMATVDVAQFAHCPVQALSGGERARVAMARVLAQQTPNLILDEPTAALDLRHQVQLLTAVRHHVDGGGAALVVLHDLSLAADFADEVVVMNSGQIAAHGSPDDVMQPALLSEIYGIGVVRLTHPVTGRPVLVPSANG